jgi:hypothetical protein
MPLFEASPMEQQSPLARNLWTLPCLPSLLGDRDKGIENNFTFTMVLCTAVNVRNKN